MRSRLSKIITHLKQHKRRSIIILIMVSIIAVVFWPKPQKPIETQKVSKTDLVESLSASGTITADPTVNLSFGIAGKLNYLAVKKGDPVKKGQVIATLDQRTVQKTLEAKLKDFKTQFNTVEQLKDDEDIDPGDTLSDELKRTLENTQNELDKAVLDVEIQTIVKEQSVLISPIAGTLTRADVTSPGVNVTTAAVFTVANLEDLVFEIEVDEADVGKVKIGQLVKITLAAYPEENITGEVSSIDYAAHTTSVGGNAYTVEVRLPANPSLQFRLGMTGDAEIIIAKRTDATVISLASITDDNAVYVKNGNYFEKREITTGIQSDTQLEVLDGLSVGEEVALQPDDAAKIVKPEKKQFFFF